eukprot:TRINITY_DN13313_c0_g1_i1.p1 TRINITY_DN13313_c0_g1~~TRINITY_DN13313_c0_g1_i1.p1  ORF type:complete len:708 (-),score=177.55 TRINITY_DN13313_c0_g1_i1:47-2002(-)
MAGVDRRWDGVKGLDVSTRGCALGDGELEQLARRFVGLEWVDLGFCGRLGDGAVRAALGELKRLRGVSFRGCVQLKGDGLLGWATPSLEHLDLRGCDGLKASELVDLMDKSPHLKALQLGYAVRGRPTDPSSEMTQFPSATFTTFLSKAQQLELLEVDPSFSHLPPDCILSLLAACPNLKQLLLWNLKPAKKEIEETLKVYVRKLGKGVNQLCFFSAYHRWDSFLHTLGGEYTSQDDLFSLTTRNLFGTLSASSSHCKSLIFGNNFASGSWVNKVTAAYLDALLEIPAGSIVGLNLGDFSLHADVRRVFMEVLERQSDTVTTLRLGGNGGTPSWASPDVTVTYEIMRKCPNVKYLYWQLDPANFGDTAFRELVDTIPPYVEVFEWDGEGGKHDLSEEDFSYLGKKLSSLEFLRRCVISIPMGPPYLKPKEPVSTHVVKTDITYLEKLVEIPNLKIEVIQSKEKFTMEMLQCIPSFTHLTGFKISAVPSKSSFYGSFERISLACTLLSDISFKNMKDQFDDSVLSLISNNCKNLHSLDISGCSIKDPSRVINLCTKFTNQLRAFLMDLNDKDLTIKIALMCSKLRIFGSINIQDKELVKTVAQCCPMLVRLESAISDWEDVGDWPVILLRMCPNLEEFANYNIGWYKGFNSY